MTMKTNRNRPGYITVQGQTLKATGHEIRLIEVVREGQKGVAIKLNNQDVEIQNLTEADIHFLTRATGFMVADVLCSLLLFNGMSANDIHDYFSGVIDYGISSFDKRIPADMYDEAQRFAEFIEKQGLSENEMTVEKMQELAKKFKAEDDNE